MKKLANSQFDDLRRYMQLPAEQKLKHVEEMRLFFSKFMPRQSKKNWQELQKKGW